MTRYKPKILVVEDDEMSRDMLVRRLASRGLRVSAAETGELALSRIDTDPPDLLLLDINLPGLSGLEVVGRLREKFGHDALPVILVTALGDSEDVIRGLEAGANDYIVKPVQFPVLIARMRVALEIKHQVSLLVEAERQRVVITALGEACHQLAQPMTAVTMTLEGLIRKPPRDPAELSQQLREVLAWTHEVSDVIHRLQQVSTLRPVPYTQRMEMLEED